MLKKLFGARDVLIPPPKAPADTRIYVVGDIHGRVDLLSRLHDRILDDVNASTQNRHLIVYLGDYVDRGLDSKGEIDLLLNKSRWPY